MAKDWVPCFGYGVGANVLVGPGPTQFLIPLVGTGLGVDPSGNQVGVPDTDPEELIVHRTIGQFQFTNVGLPDEFTELFVQVRYTTAIYNNTLAALFPFTIDLESGADANESFMNERRFNLPNPGVTNTSVSFDPRWSHWDITTKRKLRSAEWTCAVINVAAIPGGLQGVLNVRHFLRSWVTTSD